MTYKPSIPFVAALVILTGLICRMEDFIPPVPEIKPDPLVLVVTADYVEMRGTKDVPAYYIHIEPQLHTISAYASGRVRTYLEGKQFLNRNLPGAMSIGRGLRKPDGAAIEIGRGEAYLLNPAAQLKNAPRAEYDLTDLPE
jgi:hypothetical protein